MKLFGHIASAGLGLVSAGLCWNVAPSFDVTTVQAIASTVATVAGVLFGFVLASATVLASASGNPLVENSRRTQYLPKLMGRLHASMALLLACAVVFLSVLFIPRTSTISFLNDRAVFSVVIPFGVLLLGYSIGMFALVWREFAKFAKHL